MGASRPSLLLIQDKYSSVSYGTERDVVGMYLWGQAVMKMEKRQKNPPACSMLTDFRKGEKLLFSLFLQRFSQLFQRLFQGRFRTGDVDALEAFTAGAEDFTVVQPEPGFLDDEIVQLFAFHAGGGKVQPGQVRSV